MELNTKIGTKDYILLIFNCFKYRHKAERQNDTWLKTIPNNILYYHVLGNSDLEKEYIIDDKNHILYVKTPDDYNSLPKKVINAFKTIHKLYNFKYIFKTDDDQMIEPENIRFFTILMNILDKQSTYLNLTKKPHYGGNIINIVQPYQSEYYRIHPELPKNLIISPTKYCSGRFYFLSDDAVHSLIKHDVLNKISSEYLEDYAIGFNLLDNFKTNIMHLDTNKIFKDSDIV